MNKGGFSWRRLTGLSGAKARASRATGVPFTRGGRQRKIGRAVTGGGCLPAALGFLIMVGLTAARGRLRSDPTRGI